MAGLVVPHREPPISSRSSSLSLENPFILVWNCHGGSQTVRGPRPTYEEKAGFAQKRFEVAGIITFAL